MTIVYKCTTETGESATCVYLWRSTLIYSAEYTTKPECGYIFAFDSLENARKFKKTKDFAIWKAKATIIDAKPTKMLPPYWLSSPREIDNFWKEYPNPNPTRTQIPPTGTVYCSELKLLERID